MRLVSIDLLNKLKTKIVKRMFLASFTAAGYIAYFNWFNTEVNVFYNKNDINDNIINQFYKIKKLKYCSSSYFINRYFEYLYCKDNSRIFSKFEKEELNIDGNYFNIYWGTKHTYYEDKKNLPICILFPNFFDTYDTFYIKSLANQFKLTGFIPLIIEPIKDKNIELNQEIYFKIINKIKEKENVNIYFTGFGFGCNLANEILEKHQKSLNIKGIINICPITNINTYLGNLEKINLYYLKSDILNKIKIPDYQNTLRDNYKSINFNNMKVPSLNIFSLNDPLVKDIPSLENCNDNNITLVTPKGSHLNFLVSLQIKQWYSYFSSKFIEILNQNN